MNFNRAPQHLPLPQDEEGYPEVNRLNYKRTSYARPLSQDEEAFPEDTKISYEPGPHLESMRRGDFTLKRNIRFLKLFVRLTTLGLASYGVVSQAIVLRNYLTTQSITREGRNPWASETQLWPTILLLSTSSLTVLISTITLLSYCIGVKAANEVHNTAGTTITILEWCAHLAVWISTAVAYRVGKTGKDLWGWSCSSGAQDIQKAFPEVDFSFLCSTQSGSWYVSIAQAGLAIGTVVVWVLAHRRRRHQKAIRHSMDPLLLNR